MIIRSFALAALLITTPLAANASVTAEEKRLVRQLVPMLEKGEWSRARALTSKHSYRYLRDFVDWYQFRTYQSGADFTSILRFLQTHSHWPNQDTIKLRAEQSLSDQVPARLRMEWFGQFPAETAQGKVIFAEALLGGRNPSGISPDDGNGLKALNLLREAWRSGSLDTYQQEDFLKKYHHLLTEEDYREAIDALLWEYRITQAEPLIREVSSQYRKLYDARIRLIRSSQGVDRAIKSVPATLMTDHGLVYDRMMWRHKRKLKDGVRQLLMAVPDDVSEPERWWKVRNWHVWDKIDESRYKMAYLLVSNHGQIPNSGSEFAEAAWLKGWLAYAYLDNPKEAYKDFYQLYHGVSYPISRTRGAYWAGRSAEANGNQDIANRWYKLAADHAYTYYGQLANYKLNPHGSSAIPAPVQPNAQAVDNYLKKPVPRLTLALAQTDNLSLARTFMRHLMADAPLDSERHLAGQIAMRAGDLHFRVKTSKEAIKHGTLLAEVGYPTKSFKPLKAIEPALALAIARQESEFKTSARSGAGAEGLMQVLPATAKQTARKLGMTYSLGKLRSNGTYNMQIGAGYLAGLIERFEGSYPMAIAAYNAGPGRVNQWIEEFGDPRHKDVDMIQWIERIPFRETRNYVQRVLENLQIYRYRLANHKDQPIRLDDDLKL